jgi:hypothetical protein
MISEGTRNQLSWSEKHNKVVGIRFDYRSGISDNEYPVFLNYENNKEYWESLEEIVINQSEFNSVGLGFMHFMSPELNYKNNPYKVMQIWVDIGGEKKEKVIGVQQIYKDTIKCKIIGTPNQIEGVRMHKRFEEDKSWQDELAEIREYNANDFHKSKAEIKKMSNNSGGIEFVEVTSIDDYDITYEVTSDWKSYKQALRYSRRTMYLEEQLERIEDRLMLMEPWEKQIYQILAVEYGVTNFDIDERHLLAEVASDIAQKFETHPAEVWKAYWVHIEPWVRKEIEWLENNL